MGTYLLITPKQNELYHHGIKGQKWGIRRFQNKDGARTKAGKKRASASGPNQGWDGKAAKKAAQEYSKKHGITDPETQELIEMDYRDNGPDAMSKYGGSTFTKVLGKEDALDRADYLSKSHGLNLNDKEHEELLGIKATLAKDPIKGAKDLQVFEDKLGTRMNGVVLTNDDQKKLRTAVVEDRYEIDFLEAIQNEEWEYNNDKKRRDSEYERYLLDRNKYMTVQHSQQSLSFSSDELYHYGVKGMKWRQHKSRNGMDNAAVTGMGGGSVEISEEEREIQRNELASEHMDRLGSAMERSGSRGDRSSIFHTLVLRRGSAEAKRRAEVGKRKVQQIKEYMKKTGESFQHSNDYEELTFALDYTPDDLMHFGIRGMKWGIRRFQPYQKGEKVKGGKEVGAATKVKQRPSSGNIVEKYKAHKADQKKAAAVKKAQATRKAKADFEAEKKKAIESGSAEDLAKFKGKLTNEEYSRAFTRLQNEKKVADLVAANQTTVWDKIDKGMAIVQKVGGYANTIATAKENFNKLDKALNGEKDDAAKEAKKTIAENEKNRALTQITNITELDEVQKKHNLTPDEYSKGLKIISTKEAGKKVSSEAFTNQDKVKEAEKKAKDTPQDGTYRPAGDVKKNASYDNSNPSDFETPKHAYDKTPKTTREKAGYVNPDGEQGYTRPKAESGKRVISGFKSMDKPASYNSAQTLTFGESTIRRLTATAPKASQVKKDMEPTAADKERATRLANIRQTYSNNRNISGAKKGNAGTAYKQQASLNFGSSNVSRYSAKPSTPSKVVTDTRQTVANTQAEAARQREIDKKRKAKMK